MPVLQKSDDEKYQSTKTRVPFLVFISDQRRNWQGNIAGDDETPKVRNIEISDIHVYLEEGVNETPQIIIDKTIKSSSYDNISLDKFYIDGEPFDVSSFCID